MPEIFRVQDNDKELKNRKGRIKVNRNFYYLFNWNSQRKK